MTIDQVRDVLQGIRDDKTGEHRAVSYVVAEYLLDACSDFESEYDAAESPPNEVAASWLDAFDEVVAYVRKKLGVAPPESEDEG